MQKPRILLNKSTVVAAIGLAAGTAAHAQTDDGLLNKLVQKGILTEAEANELKAGEEKAAPQAAASNFGLPSWVTSLKFAGDFRGRLDQQLSDNPEFVDRTRFRYRLRAGITLTLQDDFEVGFKVGSSDSGANALSNNTTIENNGTKKPIWIDTAYAKWTPIHDGDWKLSTTIGKMVNPLEVSNMEFDPDYTPEGAAVQAGYKLSDQHSLAFNGAGFVLDELSGSSSDPYLLAGQVFWKAKWSKKVDSSLGVSAYSLDNTQNLTTANVPDNNAGNRRTAGGNLVYHYNPIVVSGAVTYKLDNCPLYQGEFPIKLAGSYMNNPAVSSNNQGYWGGVTFGKAGKKHNWDIGYRYQRLEGDAWYEEIVDDDNNAFYQTAAVGGKSGMTGGTNVKGHLVKVNYSLTDSLTFTFTGYFNELINASPAGSRSGGTRLFFDLMWKY